MTIPAGDASVEFVVTGVDDAVNNGTRSVNVSATADGFDDALTVLNVSDDDDTGFLSVRTLNDGSEFGATAGRFEFLLTTASSLETQIAVTIGGTAESGSDYTALPTLVIIPAGLVSYVLDVPVLDDNAPEDDETVTLTIDSNVSANLYLDEEHRSAELSITDNDRDTTAPTATVQTLPLSTFTPQVTLNIDLNDPPGSHAEPVSGVASYDVFVAVDDGPFTLYADDVPADQSSVAMSVESNHRYWFRAVATDTAGNEETDSLSAEANTYVGDIAAPETSVTNATTDTDTGIISLQLSGTDAGNSGLQEFRVYVSVDEGPIEEVPLSAVSAGTPIDGVYSAAVQFQGIRDGAAHTYRFFTRGVDGRGNVEADPGVGDVQITQTFAAPGGGLSATGIDVQNGETQRSFIRQVDVLFNNVTGLRDLIDNNRIQIERFALDDATPDPGTGTVIVPVNAATSGNAVRLDFGSTGLGGSGRAGNGFYRIAIDLDGNGLFDDARFEFFRLYGDADGDGKVTNADRTATEDLNGDGRITARDRIVYRRERGRKLHDNLFSELDD
ncbi:MAG: DUF5006 domain-containing protein [Planctomycetaceae bacterium]|nr:DUF5006 domain-containing protein [Planctomycetaceae bacterium]